MFFLLLLFDLFHWRYVNLHKLCALIAFVKTLYSVPFLLDLYM